MNTLPNKFKKPPKLSLLKKLNKPLMPPSKEKTMPVLLELSNLWLKSWMLKKNPLKLPTKNWMLLPNKSKKPPNSKNRPPKISKPPLKPSLKKPVKSTLFPLKFKVS